MTVDLTYAICTFAAITIAALIVLCASKQKALASTRAELDEAKGARAEIAQLRGELVGLQSTLTEAKATIAEKDSVIEGKSSELREMEGKLQTALTQVNAEKENTRNLLQAKDLVIKDQLKLIEEAKLQMKDTFASTATESLRLALEDFDTRTKSDHTLREQKLQELIKPIGDGLERLGKRCEDTDKVLTSVQSGFSEQVKSMLDASSS
ncbi:MAG: hypothetical protein KIS66_06215 [Fimbriimonadaceae bacterium]|nr:hypothetical protein [Fimbriimonadaceae bacterium]